MSFTPTSQPWYQVTTIGRKGVQFQQSYQTFSSNHINLSIGEIMKLKRIIIVEEQLHHQMENWRCEGEVLRNYMENPTIVLLIHSEIQTKCHGLKSFHRSLINNEFNALQVEKFSNDSSVVLLIYPLLALLRFYAKKSHGFVEIQPLSSFDTSNDVKMVIATFEKTKANFQHACKDFPSNSAIASGGNGMTKIPQPDTGKTLSDTHEPILLSENANRPFLTQSEICSFCKTCQSYMSNPSLRHPEKLSSTRNPSYPLCNSSSSTCDPLSSLCGSSSSPCDPSSSSCEPSCDPSSSPNPSLPPSLSSPTSLSPPSSPNSPLNSSSQTSLSPTPSSPSSLNPPLTSPLNSFSHTSLSPPPPLNSSSHTSLSPPSPLNSSSHTSPSPTPPLNSSSHTGLTPPLNSSSHTSLSPPSPLNSSSHTSLSPPPPHNSSSHTSLRPPPSPSFSLSACFPISDTVSMNQTSHMTSIDRSSQTEENCEMRSVGSQTSQIFEEMEIEILSLRETVSSLELKLERSEGSLAVTNSEHKKEVGHLNNSLITLENDLRRVSKEYDKLVSEKKNYEFFNKTLSSKSGNLSSNQITALNSKETSCSENGEATAESGRQEKRRNTEMALPVEETEESNSTQCMLLVRLNNMQQTAEVDERKNRTVLRDISSRNEMVCSNTSTNDKYIPSRLPNGLTARSPTSSQHDIGTHNGNNLSTIQRVSIPDKNGPQGSNDDHGDDVKWLCHHYKRCCFVGFPCCEKYWACHRCHNNNSKCGWRKAKSRDTQRIMCARCKTEQKFGEKSQFCTNCQLRFGEFFCATCKHVTGLDEKPYHCDKCGICRIHSDRSYHCDVCGVCLDVQLRGKHKCRAGSAHDECCICLEDAFSGCQILPCSHKVHKACATQMIRRGITYCPICRESFAHKLERRPNTSLNNQQGKSPSNK